MKIKFGISAKSSQTAMFFAILLICMSFISLFSFRSDQLLLKWNRFDVGTLSSFRSVTLTGTGVLWAGGTANTWIRTTNGGQTWTKGQVPASLQTLDFRGVAAIDSGTCWLMSAGESAKGFALIYKTSDGGKKWILQYAAKAPGIFLDGIKFWDRKHGIAFGDPVGSHFFILTTDDGGTTWKQSPPELSPPAMPAEGAFAASNTSLTTGPGGQAWIGTGGPGGGHVFRSLDYGAHWLASNTKLSSGTSAGIFGICLINSKVGVVVGGDYLKIHQRGVSMAYTVDGGIHWTNTASGTNGLEEAAGYICAAHLLVAVGPSGTCISADSGRKWIRTDTLAFHSLAALGKECWAVGAYGKIARLSVR